LRLVQWTKTWYENCDSNAKKKDSIKLHDAAGLECIPTELKVLAVLRIMGRGTCFDSIQELSGISIGTMQKFFHTWTKKFREAMCAEHVKFPENEEEFLHVMKPYSLVGFPGAVGCTDVVHVWWDKCPTSLVNLYTGKEGYPTIAYEMTCSHDGKILYCTPGFYGSQNDKSIIRFDGLISKLRGGVYKNVKWKAYDENENVVEMKDPYVLVDGGYHRWRHTISASRLNVDPDFMQWRAKLESVRKDIEDVFGILKGRFRILKLPLMFHKKEEIDNVVHCAVALHNMLRDWDGLSVWEREADWKGKDALFNNEDDDLGVPLVQGRPVAADVDFSFRGISEFPHRVFIQQEYDASQGKLVDCRVEETNDFYDLQKKLLAHFKVASRKNEVIWLRS
jgi:hypothetical protein